MENLFSIFQQYNTLDKMFLKININDVIIALKEVKKNNNKLNHLIVVLKVNKLLYYNDVSYYNSNENKMLSKYLLNEVDRIFDLTDILDTDYFNILDRVGLMELLYIMDIDKKIFFKLLNSLYSLSDFKNDNIDIINKEYALNHIRKMVLKDVFNMNLYLKCLTSF